MTGEFAHELATTRALDALPAGAWRVMHDVRVPGRRVTNVDHIAVGRAGVFVIDSRDWSGQLEVRSQVLTQDGSDRQATADRVTDSARALAEVTPDLDPQFVVPVLCFDRDEPLSGWAGEVLVCTTGNLVDLLTTQRRVWDPTTADSMFDRLAWTLPPDTYRVGAPSGPPRNGHRLEGRARTRLMPRRRSAARHVPSKRGEHMTPWIRAALFANACCLVLCAAIRFGAWPGALS